MMCELTKPTAIIESSAPAGYQFSVSSLPSSNPQIAQTPRLL